MSELRDLYQEVIFDHYKKPHNFGALPEANHVAHGHNRLCGDQLTIYLKVEGDVIRDARFEGQGCAISTASASLMIDALHGMRIEDATHLFERFHDLVTHDEDHHGHDHAASEDEDPELGKLEALAGVREFPARVKCATLPWHTLQAALKDGGNVSTE